MERWSVGAPPGAAVRPGLLPGAALVPGSLRLARVPGMPRTPLHPGGFLDSRFLKPLKLSQDQLAKDLGVSRRRINELVRGKRAVSADTAIRLGVYFATGAEFWMKLQQSWDMAQAWRSWRQDTAAGNAD